MCPEVPGEVKYGPKWSEKVVIYIFTKKKKID